MKVDELKCEDKHCDSYTRWKYQGIELISAAGYCRLCDRGHSLDVKTGKWNIKNRPTPTPTEAEKE